MHTPISVKLLPIDPLQAPVPPSRPLRAVELPVNARNKEPKAFCGSFRVNAAVVASAIDRADFAGVLVRKELFTSPRKRCEPVRGIAVQKVAPRVLRPRVAVAV